MSATGQILPPPATGLGGWNAAAPQQPVMVQSAPPHRTQPTMIVPSGAPPILVAPGQQIGVPSGGFTQPVELGVPVPVTQGAAVSYPVATSVVPIVPAF